jgi:UDP-2,3-diacylglucosamine pyrophosphatase LpxH
MMGTQAYHAALRIDGWCNADRVGRAQGGDASLSASLKDRLNRAVRYLTDFGDRAVFETARRHRADGVICGHTHKPERRRIGPIDYLNDGDWVRSCTALVEDHDGALRLLWRDHEQRDWVEQDDGAPEALS